MRILDICCDDSRECVSVITKMKLSEYKAIAYDAYKENGNLDGQRGVIKRSTVATRIRNRMKTDFNNGAVFPQVVIGVNSEKTYNALMLGDATILDNIDREIVSIIDGIQRSNVYFSSYDGNEDREIRVEFWVAKNGVQLLYRMLVLNTGQTPWNTRRQVEVIFSSILEGIKENIYSFCPELKGEVNLRGIDDNPRRSGPCSYRKSDVIEMFLGFNTRSVQISMSDELSDEYQRFDVLESIEKKDSLIHFAKVFGLMCKMDKMFSSIDGDDQNDVQFKRGRDVFGSSTVCVGFMVAGAEFVMGKISVERDSSRIEEELKTLETKIRMIIEREGKVDDRYKFLGLDVLNDVCEALPKKRIGDEMRRLFKNAFLSLFNYRDYDEINTLADFWRD